MRDEVAVTTPMLYLGMLFIGSLHAEDHDLHSLNYMHLGAAKTCRVPLTPFAFEGVSAARLLEWVGGGGSSAGEGNENAPTPPSLWARQGFAGRPSGGGPAGSGGGGGNLGGGVGCPDERAPWAIVISGLESILGEG
ncbi:hypothetical protein ZWY2020_028258 [Hordeum vulgare]|nr:hypothetical protein ZWY2020_028258 [Hordeum vulgare]